MTKTEKQITLWDVVYEIPYHTQEGVVDVEEVIEALQRICKFRLKEDDEQELEDLIDDLNDLINGIIEKYDGELSGENGVEDANMIIEELKVNPKKPIITRKTNGAAVLDATIS